MVHTVVFMTPIVRKTFTLKTYFITQKKRNVHLSLKEKHFKVQSIWVPYSTLFLLIH